MVSSNKEAHRRRLRSVATSTLPGLDVLCWLPAASRTADTTFNLSALLGAFPEPLVGNLPIHSDSAQTVRCFLSLLPVRFKSAGSP
jgi:hypothetical protein